jgi:hypothetical protein
MSLECPTYWLAYLSTADDEPTEITATAPPLLDRSGCGRDAQVLLAAADAYQSAHSWKRLVFVAEVTRWLVKEKGIEWSDLDVDFDEALADLDGAPALLIESSPMARAVVANTADHLTIFVVGGGIEDGAAHTEPCRQALVNTLERDWPAYARSVAR